LRDALKYMVEFCSAKTLKSPSFPATLFGT